MTQIVRPSASDLQEKAYAEHWDRVCELMQAMPEHYRLGFEPNMSRRSGLHPFHSVNNSPPQVFKLDAPPSVEACVSKEADKMKLDRKSTTWTSDRDAEAVTHNFSSRKMTLRVPDFTDALVGVVYNLVLGLLGAAHGIFMQWGILYIVGNLILIDFNDLLREDLEKIIGGDFPDIDSPGLIALVIWFLEAVVGVTLALTVQDDKEEEKSLVEWAWKIGRWATLPFFIVDGVAIILAIIYFTSDVGMKVTMWAAGTRFGTSLLVMMEVGIFAKTCGPSIIEGVKRLGKNRGGVADRLQAKAKNIGEHVDNKVKSLREQIKAKIKSVAEQIAEEW